MELKRNCPVCGHRSGQKLTNRKFAFSANHPLPKEYDVATCLNCGFVYADTGYKQEAYDKYYTEFSSYEDPNNSMGAENKEHEILRFERIVKLISPHLTTDSSILDIGCARGGLLKKLHQNGYRNITGMDFSEKNLHYIESEMKIETIQGGVLTKSNKKYDMIILSHVLEHILELQDAMQHLKSIVNDGGYIYIEVPDGERYSEIFHKNYFDFEHINHFDRISLSNLFNSHGFDTIDVGKEEIIGGDSVQYPTLYTLFKKSGNSKDKLHKSALTLNSSIKYIQQIELLYKNIELKISHLIDSQKPVIVRGGGSYFRNIYQNTSLSLCNLKYIADLNPNNHGMQINGIDVVSPEILSEFNGVVIICSSLYTDSIVEELKSGNFEEIIKL